MSGGVDSSVAAGILAREGYDLIGVTIKTYRYDEVGGNTANESSCCSLDGINDARLVAAHFGFPHYVLDFTEQFSSIVIDNFAGEYLAGRTPNPCVICNRKIKWEELLRKATALGADHIATGHYACVNRSAAGRYYISQGKDESKDQSYALWGLTQESLARTIFPLAEFTKPEVRRLGRDFGLANMDKPESFEICFIPDNDYERFIRERRPDLDQTLRGGEIVSDGKVVGSHRGFPFYTVGQRKGIGVFRASPLYVTRIDAHANRIEVGPEENLYRRGLTARDVNLQKYGSLHPPLNVVANVRYKDAGGPAMARTLPEGRLEVIFEEKKRAIAPGQSVVLYEGADIVGGGVIEEAVDGGPEKL